MLPGTLYGSELPKELNLNVLLSTYVYRLLTYLKEIDKKEYLPYYSTHLLSINKPVTYSVKAEERHGIIRGMNEEGHLIVELPSGEMENYSDKKFIYQVVVC